MGGGETGSGETGGGEARGGEARGGEAVRLPELAKQGTRVVINDHWHAVVLTVTSTVVAVMYDDKKWEAIKLSQCRLA